MNGRFISVSGRSLVARKRDSDGMKAGLNRYRRASAAGAFGGRYFPIPIEQVYPLAIDCDLELFPCNIAENTSEVARHALDREDVFAVGRKLVFEEQAAAGTERESFDVVVLRGVQGRVEYLQRGSGFAPDCKTADLSRGRQVGFHQCGRHGQSSGHVVETVARIVRRKEIGRVNLERNQVANRVGVFGAVQTVKARRGQMNLRTAIDLVLHPLDERCQLLGGWPPGARRRHQARADFPEDILPDLRVIPKSCEVEFVQEESGLLADVGPGIVATHTILVEERTLLGDLVRGRSLRLGGLNRKQRHRNDRYRKP